MKAIFSKRTSKVFKSIDKTTKKRTADGIEAIPLGDIRPLRGTADTYRLRIGSWRILFSYYDETTVFVEKITSRGDAYKGA